MEREGLFYPELSYELVGLAFEVYNNLGFGYQEKYYTRAYELLSCLLLMELKQKGLLISIISVIISELCLQTNWSSFRLPAAAARIQ